MYNSIIISVAVLTYNHENFIREALDSILMQKVMFRYEIVIGDDCSTDGTRSILQAYERDFPGIFKVIYRDKNIGPTKNLYDVFMHCEGKYIAQLEGDDYWTDPHKLQTQVKFLEANEEYIGVAHSCDVLCDNLTLAKGIKASYHCEDGTVYRFEDYKKKRFAGHTCTLLYRNIYIDKTYDYSILFKADYYTGDRTINMLLAAQGNIYCMSNSMSTYRCIIKKGASNVNSLYKGKNRLLDDWTYEERLNEYCINAFNKSFLTYNHLAKKWSQALVFYVKSSVKENKDILREFSNMIKHNPKAILYIPKYLIKKVFDVVS